MLNKSTKLIKSVIRTPCCAILGHVDVGKTKLLDYMRYTETEEVSGITQQIGTTLYNKERLEKLIGPTLKTKFNIDSLLMIDTPGHECFDTIRSVALIVTDVVILIIDMIKGIEKQTIHVLSLLRKYNVPFIVCLNKMDKIFGWTKPTKTDPLNLSAVVTRMTISNIFNSYKDYVKKIQIQLAEHEVNSELYYQNKYPQEFVNIVPISAETGEGIPDLIMLISVLAEKRYLSDRMIDSGKTFGYILDTRYDKQNGRYFVALHRNGCIKKGDLLKINDIKYRIKHILINTDNREIKDEHKLIRVDNIDRSVGYGLILEDAFNISKGDLVIDIEPSSMYTLLSFVEDNNIDTVDNDNENKRSTISKDDYEQRWGSYLTKNGESGILVIAPSHIMMDGLLQLLNSDENNRCCISRYKVGKIDKKDIMIASKHNDHAQTLEQKLTVQKHAVILYYDPSEFDEASGAVDNKDKEIIDFAKTSKVKIIQSNMVYHLATMYHEYIDTINKKIELLVKKSCATIEVIPKYIFRTTNPMIIGVKVKDGDMKPGMYVYSDQNLTNEIGKIDSIQLNHNNVSHAKTDDMVCLKIDTAKIIGKDINNDSILWIY